MCAYHVKPLSLNGLSSDPTQTRKKLEVGTKRPRGLRQNGEKRNVQDDSHLPVGRVWTVVANLLQALSEARDDLLALMSTESFRGLRNSNGSYVTRANGKFRSESPSRPTSAPADSRRASKVTGAEDAVSKVPNTGECTPVEFGMNLEFDKVQTVRGREPRKLATTGRIRMTDASKGRFKSSPRGGVDCANVFPEVKRICYSARYADLLRIEAQNLRERRLSEEPTVHANPSKPSWC